MKCFKLFVKSDNIILQINLFVVVKFSLKIIQIEVKKTQVIVNDSLSYSYEYMYFCKGKALVDI